MKTVVFLTAIKLPTDENCNPTKFERILSLYDKLMQTNEQEE